MKAGESVQESPQRLANDKRGGWTRHTAYKAIGTPRLPQLPSHWEARRLKFCVQLVNAKALDAGQDFYVALENIESSTGRHLPSEAAVEPESMVNRFATDDVLFGKLRPYLAKAWQANRAGVCSTEFFVLRGKRLTPSFLRWLCLSPGFVGQVDGSTFGSKMPRASWDDVGELPTPLPALSEQRAIAAFLDRETARIDALIEKKRHLSKLMQEKRAALRTHAVTRGLREGIELAQGRIAAVERIPRHWKFKRLKHISPRLMVGIVVNPSTFVSETGKPFLVGSNIKEGEILWRDAAKIDEAGNRANSKSVLRTDDLVTVRVGAPGVTAVVPAEVDGGNAASVMIIRGHSTFDSRWLCHVMNSRIARSQIEVVQYGAAQEQFNISHAVDFWIPVPPLEEQRAIAVHLDERFGKIERLLSHLAKSAEMLSEHRAALISAAVTGQIDVREAA